MQFSRFAPRPISSSSFRLFSPASSLLPLSPPAFTFSPSFFHFLPQLFSLSPPAFFTLSPSFFHFLPQLFSLSPPAFFTFSPSFFHSLPQLFSLSPPAFFTFSPSRPRFRGAPSIIWINYAHALESAIDNRQISDALASP